MSKRNISLASHLHTLSFADSQGKPHAASPSVPPPPKISKSSSSQTRLIPSSSKDRDNTSNARPTNPEPPHGKNRAREDSLLPEPPKRKIFTSRPAPVQGPHTAPVGSNEAPRPRLSGSVQLGPPFEHRPAQRSRLQHTQQSTSVSRPRLVTSLPPSEPHSPISSPDIPQASPPVPPEEQVDCEDPYDDIPGQSNISLTQFPHSRPPSRQKSRSRSRSLSHSRSRPHSPSHSPSHSRSHSSNSSQSSNSPQFRNNPPAISASLPSVRNTSTTSLSAPSRTAPGAESAPRMASNLRSASSSKHKPSRPTLSNPYPGRRKY